ncbi:MAG: hypothetical protein GKR91_05830 [Pseudomonadales bacterium]|nr:hypothetical protein [Pseudomonadales bacterium]
MSKLLQAVVLGWTRTSALFLLIVSTLIPYTSSAAEPDVNVNTANWQWIEGRRNNLSKNVGLLATSLDAWLSGNDIATSVNQSYLTVRLQQHVGSLDGFHSKLDVSGSLDLPRASERWKLIYESNPEELNSLEDSVLGNTNSSESVGGVRFLQTIGQSLQLSHDVGLRESSSPDPFYRISAKYNHEFGNNWSMGYRQKLWQYQSNGWGYDTDVEFRRKFGTDNYLSFETEIKYQERDEETEFSQAVALNRRLTDLDSLRYSVGVLGSNEPNIRINDYFTEVRWRRAIRADWMFLELVPQVVVSRDDNWRPQPRFFVNLEMMFFDF